jgi:hypothetical protein
MSRVAIFHLEMNLTIPNAQSITLMADGFKITPIKLGEGITYPKTKAKPLPKSTMTFTELELNFSLLKIDTEWLDRLDNGFYF